MKIVMIVAVAILALTATAQAAGPSFSRSTTSGFGTRR